MKKLILGMMLLTTLMSGCESMSAAECATANWREKGIQDGNQGRTDQAANYHQSCVKASIPVDLENYRAGRTQGLQSYCQLNNALNEGLAGHGYNDVCPSPIGQNFKRLHAAAYHLQETRKTLSRLQDEQNQAERELLDSKTDAKRKIILRDQLARSDRRIVDTRDELRSAQYSLDRLSSNLLP